MSRESILSAVDKNQPYNVPLPDISFFKSLDKDGSLEKFTEVLSAIGGQVVQVKSYEEIEQYIASQFDQSARIITPVKELQTLFAEDKLNVASIHDYHDVALTVIQGHIGVAENGAIWVTEEQLGHRVLPFIAEKVAIIIKAEDILPTMHLAYEKIADADYGFGAFIAGPSKTADIEQSLVIGAHLPKSMTALVIV